MPFSLAEAAPLLPPGDPFAAVLSGGYPRLLAARMNRARFFANYIDTYVERYPDRCRAPAVVYAGKERFVYKGTDVRPLQAQ